MMRKLPAVAKHGPVAVGQPSQNPRLRVIQIESLAYPLRWSLPTRQNGPAFRRYRHNFHHEDDALDRELNSLVREMES